MYGWYAKPQNQTQVPRKGKMPDSITQSNSMYNSVETLNETMDDKHVFVKVAAAPGNGGPVAVKIYNQLPGSTIPDEQTTGNGREAIDGYRHETHVFFRRPAAPGNTRRPGNAGLANNIRQATPYARSHNVHLLIQRTFITSIIVDYSKSLMHLTGSCWLPP